MRVVGEEAFVRELTKKRAQHFVLAPRDQRFLQRLDFLLARDRGPAERLDQLVLKLYELFVKKDDYAADLALT